MRQTCPGPHGTRTGESESKASLWTPRPGPHSANIFSTRPRPSRRVGGVSWAGKKATGSPFPRAREERPGSRRGPGSESGRAPAAGGLGHLTLSPALLAHVCLMGPIPVSVPFPELLLSVGLPPGPRESKVNRVPCTGEPRGRAEALERHRVSPSRADSLPVWLTASAPSPVAKK